MSRNKGGNPNKGAWTKKVQEPGGYLASPSRAFYDHMEQVADMVVAGLGEHLVVKTIEVVPIYEGTVFKGLAVGLLNE